MGFMAKFFGEPVPIIEASELHEVLAKANRPYLLDVREPVEFRHGHIAGAKLIPLGDLSVHLEELPKNREIVCICATGHRSVPAVRELDRGRIRCSESEGWHDGVAKGTPASPEVNIRVGRVHERENCASHSEIAVSLSTCTVPFCRRTEPFSAYHYLHLAQ